MRAPSAHTQMHLIQTRVNEDINTADKYKLLKLRLTAEGTNIFGRKNPLIRHEWMSLAKARSCNWDQRTARGDTADMEATFNTSAESHHSCGCFTSR